MILLPLQKNEINRDQFVRLMGGIVGNEMLKLAAAKVTAQVEYLS